MATAVQLTRPSLVHVLEIITALDWATLNGAPYLRLIHGWPQAHRDTAVEAKRV